MQETLFDIPSLTVSLKLIDIHANINLRIHLSRELCKLKWLIIYESQRNQVSCSRGLVRVNNLLRLDFE